MINLQSKKPNHSNTLILTDTILLHPKNASPLAETLTTIKEFVKNQIIENDLHNCLQILHFKSFRRIIMIFSITKIADLVFNYLNKLGIKIGFARHDNKLIHCDLDENCKTNKIVNKNIKNSNSELILLPPFDNNSNKILQASIPIDEKYPGNPIFINESNDSNFNKLEIPNPPIQMQSPPPSPYEGWIERPEEPPSITTIGFHPKTLSHLLYTYDDNNNNNNSNSIDSTIKNNSNNSIKMKKVFSSVLDSNYPTKSNLSELEDLNIGDGLHDNDDENNILKGSLFQNKVLENKERKITSNLKIPIVIVDSNEAESLKLHAAEMDKIKEN